MDSSVSECQAKPKAPRLIVVPAIANDLAEVRRSGCKIGVASEHRGIEYAERRLENRTSLSSDISITGTSLVVWTGCSIDADVAYAMYNFFKVSLEVTGMPESLFHDVCSSALNSNTWTRKHSPYPTQFLVWSPLRFNDLNFPSACSTPSPRVSGLPRRRGRKFLEVRESEGRCPNIATVKTLRNRYVDQILGAPLVSEQ